MSGRQRRARLDNVDWVAVLVYVTCAAVAAIWISAAVRAIV